MTHIIPDQALNSHVGIIGKTGGGKSYTARGLVERLLTDGRRVCILDPVGVWWGLRANSVGDGPGFPVAVFGGERADVPLSEGMGKKLGHMIATQNLPSIIDTSEMGVGERNRFLTNFLGELYRKNRRALWLVMEEADEAAPQKPISAHAPQLLDACDRIARRGRSRGFRLIMISQRPAVLNKNMLTQINTMVTHRLTAPQDTSAINDWIRANADAGQAKAVISSLPKLETGEAWVWNPSLDILAKYQMPLNTTFDSSATPDADEDPIEPIGLAEIDLSALKDNFIDEQKDEAKPNAPVAAKASKADLKYAEDRGFKKGMALGINQGHRTADTAWREKINSLLSADEPTTAQNGSIAPTIASPKKPQASTGQPPKAAEKMLKVLDTNPPIRISWNSLAASIGNKARGGHFNTVRKYLVDNALVAEGDGLVWISTPSQAAPDAPTEAEFKVILRERWKSILGGRPAEIIDVLSDAAMPKSEVAFQLQCAASGGHWNSAWKSLRDNHLVVDRGGQISLSEEIAT